MEAKAVVCPLQLAPTQLRIGNHISRSPTGEIGLSMIPEMASVQDGQIVAEPWQRMAEWMKAIVAVNILYIKWLGIEYERSCHHRYFRQGRCG